MTKMASGGMLGSGLTLVGERGPELILPQSSGLVLNNSISSRLMAMLNGAGAAGPGGSVTINVNNPVIRNDADIRKLATEISKVQASQFRTQGGRL
jgi:phage-related minor tail protein